MGKPNGAVGRRTFSIVHGQLLARLFARTEREAISAWRVEPQWLAQRAAAADLPARLRTPPAAIVVPQLVVHIVIPEVVIIVDAPAERWLSPATMRQLSPWWSVREGQQWRQQRLAPQMTR